MEYTHYVERRKGQADVRARAKADMLTSFKVIGSECKEPVLHLHTVRVTKALCISVEIALAERPAVHGG